MGDDNPYVQPCANYVELLLKSNIKLSKFFESISNKKGYLDPHKLGELIQHEFKEFSDRIFEILKTAFASFKVPCSFSTYCDTIQMCVSLDELQIKNMFFSLIDYNRDQQVCETDLFQTFKVINSNRIYKLMQEDIQLTLAHMNKQRTKLGKQNEWQNFQNQLKSDGRIQDKKQTTQEVQRFLGEVAILQNKINKKREEDDEANQEVITVPPEMKPFINKEINFQTFVDLLMDKVDTMRVTLKP